MLRINLCTVFTYAGLVNNININQISSQFFLILFPTTWWTKFRDDSVFTVSICQNTSKWLCCPTTGQHFFCCYVAVSEIRIADNVVLTNIRSVFFTLIFILGSRFSLKLRYWLSLNCLIWFLSASTCSLLQKFVLAFHVPNFWLLKTMTTILNILNVLKYSSCKQLVIYLLGTGRTMVKLNLKTPSRSTDRKSRVTGCVWSNRKHRRPSQSDVAEITCIIWVGAARPARVRPVWPPSQTDRSTARWRRP